MPHVVKHWLHGECEFNVKVKAEHECRWCVHNYTCSHDMEKLCQNFVFGRSGKEGCHSCSNHYTKWDSKQPIPCFSCSLYKQRQDEDGLYYEVWSRPKDGGGGIWFIGIVCTAFVDMLNISRYIEQHPGELPFTEGGADLEAVPCTHEEYEYKAREIRISGHHLIIFDKQWFEEHMS